MPERKPVFVTDVPVNAAKELVALRFRIKGTVHARVIVVPFRQSIRERFCFSGSYKRSCFACIQDGRCVSSRQFRICKKEQFVLDDGTSYTNPILLITEVCGF